MRIVHLAVLTAVSALTCLPGCGKAAAPKVQTLTLATTTSTQDSGLLDVLIPLFRQQTGIETKVVAVGSGQALELARRGDADVLLTHSPKAEEAFMADGFGELKQPVMHNDFVLVGPKTDPAGVKGQTSITTAFQQIAERQSAFVSRADDSGTHQKEKQIWIAAKIEPAGDWYIKSGAGMAQALRIATEKHAYILVDRATWLAQRDASDLVIVLEGDARLKNPYAVIVVSPQKHPHVQLESAQRFAAFLLLPETQVEIAKFGKEKYGEALFFVEK